MKGGSESCRGCAVRRSRQDACPRRVRRVVARSPREDLPRFIEPMLARSGPLPKREDRYEGQPTMLIAGDDEVAKGSVADVLVDFGWSDPVDIGGIEASRQLEAICIVWVKIGSARGAWDHGFKLLVG